MFLESWYQYFGFRHRKVSRVGQNFFSFSRQRQPDVHLLIVKAGLSKGGGKYQDNTEQNPPHLCILSQHRS